jgi:hypothetical protein
MPVDIPVNRAPEASTASHGINIILSQMRALAILLAAMERELTVSYPISIIIVVELRAEHDLLLESLN